MYFYKLPEVMRMSFERIKGMLLQELYITKRSLEVIIDIFYFGIITIVVYGFFSLYLTGEFHSVNAYYLILGTVLWEIVRINQYSVSVGSLWNIWSRNLSNMFVAPLSLSEFMFAQMLSGVLKTFIVMTIVITMCILAFQFNLLRLGLMNLILHSTNLIIFSWTVGIIILGFIFRYGTRIQALAWGLIFLFQPLTATFFPVSVLPPFLQPVAYILPPTYVFEAARKNLSDPSVNWSYTLTALILNIIYFLLSLWFFNYMFIKSKESGQFARNEG